jgi:predicted RNA-binding Zn ribbon-like protein
MSGVPGQLMEPGEIRWVCVDFANTVAWRGSDKPTDEMADYKSFLAWGEREGILLKPLVEALTEEAAQRSDEAQRAFMRAITLREAIYRTLFAVANKMPRDEADVALLNASYREAMEHKSLTEYEEGFIWSWEGEQKDLNAPTWRIAQSAANLLTSEYIHRLKSCPGEGCAWLFVDTTRNASRRWCDMQVCGNRAKVKRHRAGAKRET